MHLTHNQATIGSNPVGSTNVQLPEWSIGLVCKTSIRWFKSNTELFIGRWPNRLRFVIWDHEIASSSLVLPTIVDSSFNLINVK